MLQTFDHDLRVLAPQRAGERDFAVRQRRENQRAVRDALRAGHGDFHAHGFVERNDFDEFGKRHYSEEVEAELVHQLSRRAFAVVKKSEMEFASDFFKVR